MFLFACGDDSEGSAESAQTPAESQENTASAEAAEAAEAQAAEAAERPTNVRDIHGLEVTLNDDGTIALRGVDRWGSRLDTLYADKEYFGNAVPVLERSVTPEQNEGLRALLEELSRAAPAPSPSEGAEASP
jgi:hypothetical protein